MARPEITGRKLTDDPEDQHFLPPPTGPPPLSRRSYSISEFCQTEGFSRGYYYGTLKKQGLQPRRNAARRQHRPDHGRSPREMA